MSYVHLALLLLALGGAAAAYWQGRQDGRSACEAEGAREERLVRLASDAAAEAAGTAIGKIEVRNVTITQALQREVLTREVFRDCRSGVAALQLLNATPGVAQPEPSAGGSELPASGAAR